MRTINPKTAIAIRSSMSVNPAREYQVHFSALGRPAEVARPFLVCGGVETLLALDDDFRSGFMRCAPVLIPDVKMSIRLLENTEDFL